MTAHCVCSLYESHTVQGLYRQLNSGTVPDRRGLITLMRCLLSADDSSSEWTAVPSLRVGSRETSCVGESHNRSKKLPYTSVHCGRGQEFVEYQITPSDCFVSKPVSLCPLDFQSQYRCTPCPFNIHCLVFLFFCRVYEPKTSVCLDTSQGGNRWTC